jgi:dihydrofolate synthase/folylpolyglutamate synthase
MPSSKTPAASGSGRATSSSRARRAAGTRQKATVPKRGFSTYNTAVRWLYERVNVERLRPSRVDPATFKLDRMRAVMAALDDPHAELRCVHVAGTNGKGSVVAMLDSCLRESGYAVGAFTSPHLVHVRERLALNGRPISEAAFTDVLSRVGKAVESVQRSKEKLGDVTFFEVLTAAALLHFAEQAVDVAVMEVGMGGRLDATNIIDPAVCAITRIGFDHQQFLGQTIEAIAAEKAGIMKPGVPTLTIPQDDAAERVLRQKAEEVGATLEVLGKDIEFSQRFEASPKLGPHMRVGLTTSSSLYEHVPVPLPGEHQAGNCGLVLGAIDRLKQQGIDLPDIKVIDGLAATRTPGRMELVRRDPRILLDGAHNPEALGALVKAIGAHIPYDSMIMIFGCAADKDVEAMLERVDTVGDKIIFTKAKANPRAAEPAGLAKTFESRFVKMNQVADSLDEALSIARRAASRDDLICVTGSFYLVGEAKKLIEGADA